MKPTVLVTGGAGYIGSHTCKALAAAGYLPVVYDNLINGHRSAVKWGPLECGDIRNEGRVQEVVERYSPVAILHFAALAYVGESVKMPLPYYENNVGGTLCLLEVCRANQIGTFIFSSSCATYGIPSNLPILESTPQNPINPYGRSKLYAEQALRDAGNAHGIAWSALRYFNAAGADPDCEIGEDHDPETHLIPLALDAAAGTGGPLTIMGDDYDTPDGTCVRDYVHVSDLATAHVLAFEALIAGMPSEAFNLGNERGYSVREVVSQVEQTTGHEVPVVIGPRRTGDPPSLICSSARAKRTLGWTARMPDLSDMVATAWRWRLSAR